MQFRRPFTLTKMHAVHFALVCCCFSTTFDPHVPTSAVSLRMLSTVYIAAKLQAAVCHPMLLRPASAHNLQHVVSQCVQTGESIIMGARRRQGTHGGTCPVFHLSVLSWVQHCFLTACFRCWSRRCNVQGKCMACCFFGVCFEVNLMRRQDQQHEEIECSG